MNFIATIMNTPIVQAAVDTSLTGGGDGWPDERRGGPFILFPLLMLALLVAAFFAWRRRRGNGDARRDAEQTLRERFARGEIDQREYAHRHAVLAGADTIPPAPNTPAPTRPADTPGADTTEPPAPS